MNRPRKKACVLLDESDRFTFSQWPRSGREEICWFPLSYRAMLKGAFDPENQSVCFPDMGAGHVDAFSTGSIHAITQAFLGTVFRLNPVLEERQHAHQGFPLEYYWYCLFTALHRLIFTLRDLYTNNPVYQLFIIKRSKTVNIGGMSISLYALGTLLETYCRYKGWRVETIEPDKSSGKKSHGIPLWPQNVANDFEKKSSFSQVEIPIASQKKLRLSTRYAFA